MSKRFGKYIASFDNFDNSLIVFSVTTGSVSIFFLSNYPIYIIQTNKAITQYGYNQFFFISGGTVRVKTAENSRPLAVTHLNDFTVHFPNVDLSPPSESSQLGFIIRCVHIKYISILYQYFLGISSDTSLIWFFAKVSNNI